MSNDPFPSMTQSTRPGYPLGLLFILIAVVATLLALDVTALKEESFKRAGIEELLARFGGAGMFGGVLGIVIGAFHYRRGTGILCGLVTGTLLVPTLLPLLMAEKDHVAPLLIATVVGCTAIIGLAVVIRLGAWQRSE